MVRYVTQSGTLKVLMICAAVSSSWHVKRMGLRMSRIAHATTHTTWLQTPDHTVGAPVEKASGKRPRHADTDATSSADVQIKPSKSQRKREAHAMQALGEQLVILPRAHLARLELPVELRQAVLAAPGMRSHRARARQMRFIGKLMRQLDPSVLRTICEALDPKHTILRPPPCHVRTGDPARHGSPG